MAKRKKQELQLALLVLVLVILIAAYVLYGIYESKNKKEQAAEEQTDTDTLVAVEEDSLIELHYKNELGDVQLVKGSDGSWTQKNQNQIPVNQTYVKKMTESLEKLEAVKVIVENAEDLSEYGLDGPLLTVEAERKEEPSIKVLVGDKSPFGDGYYACVDGEKKVYLIAGTFFNTYHYGANDLIEHASAPTIAAENVTHILIKDSEKGTLEIKYEEDNPYDYSGSELTPYVIQQGYEIPIAGDADQIKAYLSCLSNLSYQKCIDYEGKDLAKYGFDQPTASVQIDYYTMEDGDSEKAEHSYQLLIGSLTEEETSYYVKEKDSNSVYIMDRTVVEPLRTYQIFDLLNKYPHLLNLASVTEVVCSYNEENHTLAVEHTKEKNEDGKEEKKEVFTLDGAACDENTAKQLYQTIIGVKYQAEIPNNYSDSDKPIVAKLEFKRTSESKQPVITVEYREYDESFYTAAVNGEEFFLVDKRDIMNVVRDMNTALGK